MYNNGGASSVEGIFIVLLLAFLAFIGFIVYLVFKQLEFIVRAINLYEKMVTREDTIIKLLIENGKTLKEIVSHFAIITGGDELTQTQQDIEPKPQVKPIQQVPSPEVQYPVAIHLRREPLTVSEKEVENVFKVSKIAGWMSDQWQPLKYIQNNYIDRGDVVVDYTTGLMWQKSGSDELLTYEDAQKYIETLNHQKFAEYADWRIPTIPELISLLEQKQQSNKLYINPIFDTTQNICWGADKSSSGAVWYVSFTDGGVGWFSVNSNIWVRAVRS